MTREATLGTPGSHLDDGLLVRRLDDELDPAEAGRVEDHLAGCARCRSELDAIAALSRRVSSALPLVDGAPVVPLGPDLSIGRARSAWPGSAVWRAAAAIAFLAGLALAISPVRAWIAGRLGLEAGRPAAESAADRETLALEPVGGGVRVAFVPTGDRFRVLVAVPQLAGALRLESTTGDTATGEVLGPGDADLLVLPDGLGIRNARSYVADYRVAVPRDLAEVEVRVGGRVTWAGSPAAFPASGMTIDISDDEP